MSNQRNSLNNSVKEQILLESDDPQCVITKLASKHGVTANQIYNWRSQKRQHSKPSVAQALDDSSDHFIELVRVLTTFLRKCNIRENSILQKACRALDLQFS